MVHRPSSTSLTPVSIEEEFRALLHRLSYPWSARKQLTEIEAFLRQIRVDSGLYESYILEISQRIPGIVARLNVFGIDPAKLRPLYEELKQMIIALPSLSSVKGLGEAMQRLRRILSVLYHYVGDIHHGSEFDVKELPATAEDLATYRTESILVPVVERGLLDAPGSLQEYGYLRRISIEITGQSKSESDVFFTQALILGQDGGLTNTLVSPVLAARSHVLRALPNLRNKYFSGFVTFDELNAFHQGSSANFAIATLLCCVLLKYVGARNQFRLNKNVTMTGDINQAGEMLAVDDDSLKLKTEAAFFSDIQFFVVPKQQLSTADAMVQSLRLRYPHRALTVIGLSHLKEVFYDRRLTSETKSGILGHAARRMWRHKIEVATLTTIAVLLLIVAKISIPPANDNPVSVVYRGENMLIQNDDGQTLEEINVGPLATVAGEHNAAVTNTCKFFDINGDGKNEFIFVKNNGGSAGEANVLVCRSLWRKIPRWQISFHETASFPKNPVDGRRLLLIDRFILGNFEGSQHPEVFVLAHHLFFPSVVYKLNALNGNILGSFLHVGHLGVIGAGNTLANGTQQILVAGWNSAYNCTGLCVLDPRFVSGHSPVRGTYTVEGSSPGTEMYYILIPASTVAQKFSSSETLNGPESISFNRSEESLTLEVNDLSARAPEFQEAVVGLIVFTFDRSMRLVNVNTTSTWDRAAQILLREGKLKHIPDALQLTSEYRKSLRYWDGKKWEHTPTLNEVYVDAVNRIERE